MSGQQVDVLGILDHYAEAFAEAGDADREPQARELREARAAVAELAKAGKRVTDAFRALGKAGGMVEVAKRHQECEAAMLALDAAVSRVQGGAA